MRLRAGWKYCFFLLPLWLWAQRDLGCSWIKSGQSYIALETAVTGIYRASPSDLIPYGLPAGLPLTQLRIYFRGQEIKLYLSDTNSNGIFDGNDFLEFYGIRNDGKIESQLYVDPLTGQTRTDFQPNAHTSIFWDTASYFLTWESGVGQRYSVYSLTNYSSYSPQSSFPTESTLSLHTSPWITGGPTAISNDNSDFVEGEGYYDLFPVTTGNTRTYTVSHPGIAISSPRNPELRVRVFGYSLFTHSLDFQLGSLPIENRFSQGIHLGTEVFTIPAGSLTGNSSPLDITAKYNPTDNNYISWIQLAYDRSFQLSGIDSAQVKGYSSTSNAYWVFTGMNCTPSDEAIVYDLTSGSRIGGTCGNSKLEVIVQGSFNTRDLYVTHSQKVRKPSIRTAHINRLALSNGSPYLLITHKSLAVSAQAYADLRRQSTKNPQPVFIVYTEDIYDEFGYGMVSPLAIRNFLQTAWTNWTIKPKYVMMWGKGKVETIARNTRVVFTDNLVPVWGYPGSDWYYVSGYDTTQNRAISNISIGRVNINSDAEGQIFLDKMFAYESQPWEGNWMKDALHLGGGENASEQQYIQGYLDTHYRRIWEGIPFGGKVSYQQKSDNPIPGSISTQEVRNRLNQGVHHLTFFGHSTNNIFDIDIREATEYSNFGKYPLILANGCYAGNFTLTGKGFSERFMLEPGKGCIGYVSSTSLGSLIVMGEYMKSFHEVVLRDSIGKPLGPAMQEAIRRFVETQCVQVPSCPTIRNHAWQICLQGDPAMVLAYPEKPDYEINAGNWRFTPDPFSPQDSVTLSATIRNLGRATADSIPLTLIQIPQSGIFQGQARTYGRKFNKPVYNIDTCLISFRPGDDRLAGLSTFTLWADSSQQLNDANYLNNTSTLNKVLSRQTPAILYPPNFAIVGNSTVELCASAYQMSARSDINYTYEIDTASDFSSPSILTSGNLTGQAVLNCWQVPLTLQENQVYYWRVRLTDEPQAGWTYASFRYLNGQSGWSQARIPQYLQNEVSGLIPQIPNEQWAFTSRQAQLTVQTPSSGTARMLWDGIKVSNNDNQATVFNGVWLAQISADRLRLEISDPLYGNWKWFPMPSSLGALGQAIQQIPTGDWGLICSQHNPRIASWANDPAGESAYQAIESLGGLQIRNLLDNKPYILFGKKGGVGKEILQPNIGIYLELDTLLTGIQGYGEIKGPPIGPAKNWQQANFYPELSEPSDSLVYEVWAKNRSGNDSLITIVQPSSFTTVALSNLSATLYPNIYFQVKVKDEVVVTPPQPRIWEARFISPGDAIVNPAVFFKVTPQPAPEGEEIKVSLSIKNPTLQAMDSILVRFQVLVNQQSLQFLGQKRYAPLEALNSILIDFTFPTQGIPGQHTLIIEVNPNQDQPELYAFNNLLYYPIQVVGDKVNPVLEVKVDGRNIHTGEVVSPTPEIMVQVKDDNDRFILDSMGCFRLSWEGVGGSDSLVLLPGNPQVRFEPAQNNKNQARLYYYPGPLPDGLYTFRAMGYDRLGNPSGEEPLEVKLEVINARTLTPVFNYPNPFSTRTQFVFTLTGDELPSIFQVDIYTISGRLVRQLDLRAWGDLHIGQNLSTLEWDGTDDYGDRLANGVYLYKVKVKYADGSQPSARVVGNMGDLFTNGFGKLVIFR